MHPVTIVIAFVVVYTIAKCVRIVPQKQAFIVERLGKYHCTLDAGLHLLMPIVDRVSYKHTLKEQAIDVPPQQCITRDNITVEVDGILYLQVMDPAKASYGIANYLFATTQLAQTTMRSEMGKLELDKSFEERMHINGAIVEAVDKASDPWGIKVTRYEIKNITPPQTIRDAMEKQMRAEREKRALIAESEGDRQAKINRAEGEKQQAIAISEGEKMKRINEAGGRAQEILLVAEAQANGLRQVASAINEQGGMNAVNMQLAQQYLNEFGKMAKANNTMIVPSDLANVAGILKAASTVIKEVK
jgi:regulator of protease activity HflC (stomatin/prohibitin superfamily)